MRAGLVAGAVLIASIGFSLSFAVAQDAAGKEPGHARIEELLRGLSRGHSFGQVAISPDGKRLAWIEFAREGAEIRVAPLDDLSKGRLGKSERVTAADKPEQYCQEGQIVWSPDAQALAFFSDCAKPGQPELYLARQGKPSQRLTELKGYTEAPAFSPDGKSVAFLYVEGATRAAGALAAMKPPAGVIGEDGVEIQRVAIAAVDAGKPAAPVMSTPENLHVYEFDWRPDSKALAYVAANPPGENNWWVAKLYTQELDGAPKVIFAPAVAAGALHGLQVAVPRWSPDSKVIAFIGGLMSDQGVTGGNVWMVSTAGGTPRNLTPQRAATASWMEWDDASHIFVSSLQGGNSQLARLDLQDDSTVADGTASFEAPLYDIPATAGDGRLEMSLSFARSQETRNHELFAFTASSFDQPPEIYMTRTTGKTATSLSALTQVTHLNDGVEPAWGYSVSLTWKSDKFHVQGWLTLPKEYDPARKYPLIVMVHGGPASAAGSRWSAGGLSAAAFSALGYFVLQPNPRGSFGQGEEFTQANRKDFGYGDLRDILAGVDTVEAKYPVDPNRVGLTGWSYGGFMTMFAVTQTQRFKAAVSGPGISNWQSYYGENSIDQWLIPYFGAPVYDNPSVYAKSSAINFIQTAQTPTLLMVGDRDGECPAPQSYEFWHALKARNVPTQLVVYPNEGHMFADPIHRRDVIERAAEWFAHYLPPAP
jgi:dipeptidyl aminopeptidase/acylaminoacyl peptidase